MKKTLYLIHHSHTDIGYTDTQERALHHQVNYISHILQHFHSHSNSSFKWNCETFVCVEEFIKSATPNEKLDFISLIKQKKIDVSANFANFSEILDPNIMNDIVKRATFFAKQNEISLKCAMQADVNGFSLGYANALVENGIEFFLTLVHTHHGMFPLYKKQLPFFWEMPSGKKLLVWSGEHYMFGNAFGFAKGAMSSYGFDYEIDVNEINRNHEDKWLEFAERRMRDYLNTLTRENYPFDFFPACIQGKYTDNAMPNFSITERVSEWNTKFSDWVEVKMVTLSELYEIVKKIPSIPTYHGEWPDWWTDGVASAPRELKIFKNTQRKFDLIKQLGPQLLQEEKKAEIEYDLALYAEHTYGAWSSIHNPYDAFAHESWAGKQWYLFNAMRNIDKLYITYEKSLGSIATHYSFSGNFLIQNPNPIIVNEILKLPFHNADYLFLNGKYEISDENHVYSYFCDEGNYPHILIELKPYEIKHIRVKLIKNPHPSLFQKGLSIPMYSTLQVAGTDNISDIEHPQIPLSHFILSTGELSSPYYHIKYNTSGIYSIIEKSTNNELLTGKQGLFQGIYEVSRTTPRSQMGRNRKGIDVERYMGQLIKVNKIEQNDELFKFSLIFSLQGCENFEQIVTLYSHIKKISFAIKVHKTGVLDPESLYFSLPVTHTQLHLDKISHSFIPRKNQLPGSLIDFYASYEGVIFQNENFLTLISTPDTHLIHYGDLHYKNRKLFSSACDVHEDDCYIWVMNNIWETNFLAHLGDFYEFRYELSTETNITIQKGFDIINSYNRKIIAINI